MAKLPPDYIKWVLSLETSQVQKEIHRIEKENKGLQKQMNATRKRMAELAEQGKNGSEEWNNLSKFISVDQLVNDIYETLARLLSELHYIAGLSCILQLIRQRFLVSMALAYLCIGNYVRERRWKTMPCLKIWKNSILRN